MIYRRPMDAVGWHFFVNPLLNAVHKVGPIYTVRRDHGALISRVKKPRVPIYKIHRGYRSNPFPFTTIGLVGAHLVSTIMVSWWFGILGVPLSNNSFHKGILGIQTTNPNHQLRIS